MQIKNLVHEIILLHMKYHANTLSIHKHKLESFTTSKTDRHLLRQKLRQRMSVMKTNTL